MKKLFFSLFLFIFSAQIFAGPGDTIVIQTFEFDGFPVGEGWLAPRQGVFDFTEIEGKTFSKILAYYTLKCDPGQSPACGEWDYLSYLQLREHTYTGNHPNFKLFSIYGATPDEYSYMNSRSWDYFARFENTFQYSDPSNFDLFSVGSDNLSINYPFITEKKDNRTMFLWRASDLTNSGLSAGIISAIQLNIIQLGDKINKLTIRIKPTSLNSLSVGNFDTTGFFTVYSKNTQFDATGWQDLIFSNQFNWDGTSNLIIDFYFDNVDQGTNTIVEGNSTAWNCGLTSIEDFALRFNNRDALYAPVDNLNTISENVTISFWAKGNPDNQPANDYLFEALDSAGNRVLNVHLPWGDEKIYFDAGSDGLYDRIYKAADSPGMYENEWHHWAFVKNGVTDSMKIYFDGELWHSGSWKFRNIGQIDTLVIGKGVLSNTDGFYSGNIDEFQIWDIALDQQTIQEWMIKDVNDTHQNYNNLKLYYKFNSNIDFSYFEEISETNSSTYGTPDLVTFNGNRFKNFTTLNERPNINFLRHNSDYTIDTTLVIDSVPLPQELVYIYDQLVPDEKPVVTNILTVWPSYYTYEFDQNGQIINSTFVDPDVTLIKEIFSYYTTDINEEITIPWELGRFITPYGNGLDLDDGWTWIFDVTKFQNLLVGDNVFLKAGNFQELLDLKFYFIEGTPPRDFVDVQKVWTGNFQLSTFDNEVTDTLFELNPDGEMFELHTTLTGHWFGQGNNCGEFCPNIHSVEVNGTEQYSWQIIQDCGLNPLFPQGGTWIYDRAGWCPGMPATIQHLDITPFINIGTDTDVLLDYDIEYDPYGNYVTETFFTTYGDYNFSVDAELEEIIAPNNFKLNTRYNPICGQPIIKIKNNGEQQLTSLQIEYGLVGGSTNTYNWSGELNFSESEIINLPAIDYIEFYDNNAKKFYANISNPNNTIDEYEFNNSITTEFDTVPLYNKPIIIHFKSNKDYWENSYEILDNQGNIVYSRDEFEYYTVHYDTLDLEPGCYQFVVYDSGGDGMYDWPSSSGTGYIKFYDIDENLYTSLEPWFGAELRHQFVSYYPLDIKEVNSGVNFLIYPNPTNGILNVKIEDINATNKQISIFDVVGKKVYSQKIDNISEQINLSYLKSGVYFIKYEFNGKNEIKKFIIQ